LAQQSRISLAFALLVRRNNLSTNEDDNDDCDCPRP
jgi:hypothetical protein